jgi:hypothetical protein
MYHWRNITTYKVADGILVEIELVHAHGGGVASKGTALDEDAEEAARGHIKEPEALQMSGGRLQVRTVFVTLEIPRQRSGEWIHTTNAATDTDDALQKMMINYSRGVLLLLSSSPPSDGPRGLDVMCDAIMKGAPLPAL